MSGRFLLLTVLMTALGSQAANAAPIINFEGSTSGCFGAACGSFTSPATHVGLTFTGVDPFVASVDANTADFEVVNLAAFAVNRSIENHYTGTAFTLRVLFSLPNSLDAGFFPADITGTISGNGNGTINVHFDDAPFVFSFSDADGTGTFELVIVNDPQLQKGTASADALGRLQNVNYTLNSQLPAPTPVPEPASMVLMGASLIVALRRSNRRRRS